MVAPHTKGSNETEGVSKRSVEEEIRSERQEVTGDVWNLHNALHNLYISPNDGSYTTNWKRGGGGLFATVLSYRKLLLKLGQGRSFQRFPRVTVKWQTSMKTLQPLQLQSLCAICKYEQNKHVHFVNCVHSLGYNIRKDKINLKIQALVGG
jgi:hypothetical protein